MHGKLIALALVTLAACGPADMDGAANDGDTIARGEDTAIAGSRTTGRHTTGSLEAELMQMERDFAAASAREGASAWSSRWAANGRSYFGNEEHVGPAAVGAAVAPMLEETGDRFTWWPDTAVVAASGDLGYTLGRYAVLGGGDAASDTVARGYYVTVWQKQADGSWKIAVDIGT